MNDSQKFKVLGFVAVGFIVLATFMSLKPFKIVDAGNVGIVKTFGSVATEPLSEGFHVINPLSNVIEVSTRLQKSDPDAVAISRDLQQVTSKVVLSYHMDAGHAVNYYVKVGSNAETTLIEPAIQESLKAVTAKYSAEELISKREEVRTGVKMLLAQRLRDRSFSALVVDDLAISEFAFSKQFQQAIESKMEAAQIAEKAKNDLARVQVEAQQKITQAKAEAEKLQVQRSAITDQLLQLRKLENEKAAIARWDGHMPTTMAGNAVPFLNVSK